MLKFNYKLDLKRQFTLLTSGVPCHITLIFSSRGLNKPWLISYQTSFTGPGNETTPGQDLNFRQMDSQRSRFQSSTHHLSYLIIEYRAKYFAVNHGLFLNFAHKIV